MTGSLEKVKVNLPCACTHWDLCAPCIAHMTGAIARRDYEMNIACRDVEAKLQAGKVAKS